MMTSNKHRLAHEALESRQMLSAEGIIWGADARLTISFAPDGTPVADEVSQLFSQMGALASEAQWQGEILRGFQTWARETNGDLGVVADDGSDFGTPGRLRQDPRFGDVRVGSIPLDNNLVAISVPSNEIIDGTWTGELLFNSNYQFTALDEIFAVALHEAGHVFGLEHSDDPNSPMFQHGVINKSTVPTADDLDALHDIFGERSPDVYDLPDDGEVTPQSPVELELFEVPDGDEGSAPSLAFADITSVDDVDAYFFETPDGYSGDVRIELVTSKISLLTPSVVVSKAGDEVDSTTSNSPGTDLTLVAHGAGSRERYDIEVRGVGTEYAIGGYSLLVWYDAPLNQVNAASIESFVRYPVRHVESEELGEYFEDGQVFHLHDDDDMDNLPGQEMELETTPGFVEGTRYQIEASIESASDVDRYKVKAPEFEGMSAYGRLTLRAVDPAISPAITVFDQSQNELQTNVLINNDEMSVVQLGPLTQGSDYFIEISAANYSTGASGVYEFFAELGTTKVERSTLTQNRLLSAQDTDQHRLILNRPQLFHFSFRVDDTQTPDVILETRILDQSGHVRATLTTSTGNTRTTGILLPAGSYRLIVRAVSVTSFANLGYSIAATAVDDPLGPQSDSGQVPFVFSQDDERLLAAVIFNPLLPT